MYHHTKYVEGIIISRFTLFSEVPTIQGMSTPPSMLSLPSVDKIRHVCSLVKSMQTEIIDLAANIELQDRKYQIRINQLTDDLKKSSQEINELKCRFEDLERKNRDGEANISI